MLSGTIHTSHL